MEKGGNEEGGWGESGGVRKERREE